MFRPMRRKQKEMNIEAAKELLHKERRGVFAVNGDDGYPFAIPVNYYYMEEENKIIFHGARAGHKVDALRENDKVCFTVYGNERIKDLDWAPYMQSVVIFGRCRMVDQYEEYIPMVRILAGKYFPNEEMIEEEIKSSGKGMIMYEINIEYMTGKEIQER